MSLLWRQGLRYHSRHALQTLLTLTGIALGTALLCAMQLSQRTAERAFDLALEAVAGSATHTVQDGPRGLPVQGYVLVQRALGGRGVAPAIRAVARVPDRPERTVLRVLGIDPLADVELRPWSSPAGAEHESLPLGPLLTTPGGFVATAPLLQRLGLGPGDTLRVTLGGRPHVGTCLGVLAPPPLVAAGLEDVLVVDIATAQEWTGRLDRIDRLDLRLAPELLPDGMTEQAALAAVAAAFGPGVQIVAAGANRGGLAQLARGFRINLRALSLLSLLVGAFLVHETMRLSVAARRPSFGVLRALGARPRSLGVVVTLEAAVLGLFGSLLGAGLGVAFAQVLLDPLARTLNDHYATFALHGVHVDGAVLLLGVLLGTAVATCAGLGPALAAARVPAREVLVQHHHEPRRRTRRQLWAAVSAAGLALWLLLTAGAGLVQAYLGVLAMLTAAVLLVPAAMGCLLWGAGAGVRGAGPFVRYVVRSTAAARDHLALPVAAMVLAIAATLGLATLVGSFRDSVAGWLTQVLPADVYVSVPGGVDERGSSVLAPEVVAALRTAPQVAAASTYQRTRAMLRSGSGEGEVELVGMDPTPAVLASFPFLVAAPGVAREALPRGEGVWVSEPLAFRWQLAVGDALTVATERGAAVLPILAIYRDYGNERGEVLAGKAWFDAHLRGGITALALETKPGTDVDASLAELRARAAAAAEQDVGIRSQRELRLGSLAIFDRTFAITGVMRLLCLLVAFFGIYSAFATLQLERGAEVGLLRCLGARPRQVGLLVLGQTALLGLCAGLLALPTGALLGHVLAEVVNRVSFGWSLLEVTVPRTAMVEAVLLALVAAVLAGVQPAVRFARMRPADGLREA
ncbi:MAG TPA: FtsX-like permease family protein [Planctomycetota bacterium]|nr:FtsX-like permease family protein [Planctomycetota bacterium]